MTKMNMLYQKWSKQQSVGSCQTSCQCCWLKCLLVLCLVFGIFSLMFGQFSESTCSILLFVCQSGLRLMYFIFNSLTNNSQWAKMFEGKEIAFERIFLVKIHHNFTMHFFLDVLYDTK